MNSLKTWSKSYKKVLDVTHMDYANDYCDAKDKIGQIYHQPKPISKGVLMHPVGKKDIHNKEIYEKYIVKDLNGNLFVVDYNPAYCAFMLLPNGATEGHSVFYPGISLEIVGNVWENSDMLKPKK